MPNSSFDSGSDNAAARSVLHQPTEAENNWRPDLSKERPEWRAAHSNQKDAALEVDKDGVYVVKDGDTLYDIARRSLKTQNAATDVSTINQEITKIVEHNVDAYPGLSNNPHLIHPGDQLRLGIHPDASATLNVPPLNTDTAPPVAPTPDAALAAAPALDAVAPAAPSDVSLAAAPPAAVPLDGAPVVAPAPVDGTPQPAAPGGPPPLVQVSPDAIPAPITAPGAPVYVGDPAYAGAAPPSPPDISSMSPNPGSSYGPPAGGDYTDQEAYRLSQMMINDPHAAANEMRNQIQQIDPGTAGVLIAKTKNDELVGGLGDLQIQVEFDQIGRDTGYRNVTMATPDGIEQIAELQAQPQGYNSGDPLGYIAGAVVGDLLWQQNRGMNFNDDQYRGWCNREQGRENYWYSNNSQFVQNWQNPNFRNNYQSQNWQSAATNPTVNNTYITNNRYDTTINNRTVNSTVINQTINNSKAEVNTPHPKPVTPVTGGQLHRVGGLPAVTSAPAHGDIPTRPAQVIPIAGKPQTGASEVAAPSPEVTREKAAAIQTQQAELAREKPAAIQTQQAELAREKAAAIQTQQAEVAREKAAAIQTQQAEAAREKAAAIQTQQAEAARVKAAAIQTQQAELAREKAAAIQTQQAELAREKAAAIQTQQAEAARVRAAAVQTQQAEAAREKAAAVQPKAPVVPPPKKN
jgi:hypothetical protein